MTTTEFYSLLEQIKNTKAETQWLEIKSAANGVPTKLYDTLSSFSNQDSGGVIVFGINESNDFEEVGVYDAQDLQKHIVEQCNQMTPKIRAVFTLLRKDGKNFVCAEIPGIDISERPCYYSGKGRIKGSYIRLADADLPMTEYEIYSYEAFKKKYQDDIREVKTKNDKLINRTLLTDYLNRLKLNRPNLSALDDDTILELMGMTRNGNITLATLLLFGNYPQAVYPGLCITAVVVPGTEYGETGTEGERFIDNKRIEGTLVQMLDEAISFVNKNMKTKTIIDDDTGAKISKHDYPIVAVREIILNALVHRDYSVHTESMPIQIVMYEDRLEVKNPGGLYGRMTIDQLGKLQPDTRNPVLASAMELLDITENRYSGIPTIYRQLRKAGMKEPIFDDKREIFSVCIKKGQKEIETDGKDTNARLINFCKTPKTREEISDFLGIKTVPFAIKKYVNPLAEKGLIKLKYPDTPRSRKQRYYSE